MSTLRDTLTNALTQEAALTAERDELSAKVLTLVNAASAAKVTIESQAKRILELEAAKPPIVEVKPTKGLRGPQGQLADLVLNGKAFKGDIKLTHKTIIGAPGQKRLIDPHPGTAQRFEHCDFEAVDATSASEETTLFGPNDKPYWLWLTNCELSRRTRHGLFLQCRTPDLKPITDPAVMFVRMARCVTYSSDYETPLRFMEAVDVEMDDCYTEDTVDIGGNKANGVARFHCRRVKLTNSTFKGMVKFGFELGTFPTDIECENVEFIGAVQFEGPIGKKIFKNCTLNGKPYNP